MQSVPIPVKVSTNFCRRPYSMNMSTSESKNLNDLYDRVPEQSITEMAQTDEEFYKFHASEKSKFRSLSLPPIRGKFVLLSRRMNTSPTEKKRSEYIFNKQKFLFTDDMVSTFLPARLFINITQNNLFEKN